MRYYFEMVKDRKVFSAGYIEAATDSEAIFRMKSDINNGNAVFLQRCDSEKILINSWPREVGA